MPLQEKRYTVRKIEKQLLKVAVEDSKRHSIAAKREKLNTVD